MAVLKAAQSPSIATLVSERVAERLHAKDASLFDFSESAKRIAKDFMGWSDLASNPRIPVEEISAFADTLIQRGINTVVLIGQGGSTQAPMTITKYNKPDKNRVYFRTIDSMSPVRLREFMDLTNPKNTLIIVSSTSGETLEPRMVLQAVRGILSESMPQEQIPEHILAITDPGTELEKLAIEEGWLKVFHGDPSVGGRYSALSVFGLLPAALVGVDLKAFMEHACQAEAACSANLPSNPAIQLAAYLYDNYLIGRDKFSFLTPQRGRVLGLWIEQLVAESLGKDGKGILPNIELDPMILADDRGDRCAIVYRTKTDLEDEQINFDTGVAYLGETMPRLFYEINNVEELSEHFVMWEYAIAMVGYLMKVCPFDQPDVSYTKAAVLDILENGLTDTSHLDTYTISSHVGDIEVHASKKFTVAGSLRGILRQLFKTVKPGMYFSLNAFLPFTGEGRREALESIRHNVARACGIPSCLEVGPRYLHSTGQLHKGGPNNGVFLIISANEQRDVPLEGPAKTMGEFAYAQATGDALILAQRGRSVVHIHLPDNSGGTLRRVAYAVEDVLAENLRASKW